MRVNLELGKLLGLLGALAQEARDQARVEFADKADAVILGISYLFDHLQQSLSGLEEYDLSPEPQAQLLLKAVQTFCSEDCSFSREVAPGSHEECLTCRLMPFTAQVVERAVERALGDAP